MESITPAILGSSRNASLVSSITFGKKGCIRFSVKATKELELKSGDKIEFKTDISRLYFHKSEDGFYVKIFPGRLKHSLPYAEITSVVLYNTICTKYNLIRKRFPIKQLTHRIQDQLFFEILIHNKI